MARMKTCKRCAKEIPATATRCEYCGSLQRAGCLGAVVVILCIFLVLVWIAIRHMYASKPGPQTAASRAESLCEQAVRKAASHPTSVDFSEFGRQPPIKMPDGSYQDRLAFKEKDAQGDAIAKEAICTVKDGKLLSLKELR